MSLYDDISEEIISISGRIGYEDALTVGVPSGAISGDLDVELASGSKYSYFQGSSPFHGGPRLNRELKAYAGFTVSGTDEYLQQFDGYTDRINVSAGDRKTSLHATDKSILLKRKEITWPLMKDVPSDYLIRALLAEVGISDGHTNDNQTIDMWKFDGTLTSDDGIAPASGAGTFYEGKWGTAGSSVGNANLWYNAQWVADTQQGFVAWWQYFGTGTGDSVSIVHHLYEYPDWYNRIRWYVNNKGTVYCDNKDNTKLLDYTGTFGSGWHHQAFTWDCFDGSHMRYYLDGSQMDIENYGTKFDTWRFRGLEIITASNARVDHLSYGTVVRTAKDIEGMYAASLPDDDATDIDVGYNLIDYVYLNKKNAWNTVKGLCEAETATFYFDSQGKAHFENRYHLQGPPHDKSQKTISYDDDIEDLTLNEELEQRINKVTVLANPMQEQEAQDIWSANDVIFVPRSGSIEFWANFKDPSIDVDTSFTAGTTGSQSRFLSCAEFTWGSMGTYTIFPVSTPGTFYDYSGSVTLSGTAYAKSMRIIAANINPHMPLPLRDTSGNPYVKVWGKPISTQYSGTDRPDTISYTYQNDEDIATYGERGLEINNDFIQNPDYADLMAQFLLAYYGDPRPTLDTIEIMGDPRLEPGDRVTVVDSGGVTGLNHDYWVTGIDWSQTPAYKQKLKLAYAGIDSRNFFVLDHGTLGRLDYNILGF